MTRLGFVAALSFLLTVTPLAQERDRASVPDKHKWDLAQIFSSDEAWRAARDTVTSDIPRVGAFKGQLGSSAARLAEALELATRVTRDLVKVYVYASMMSDQDSRDSRYQAMQQEMVQLYAAFAAQAAYMEPEILALGREKVDRLVASEPRLETFRFYLHDIVRRGEHTLSAAEEKLLADSSVIASGPSNTYGIFSDAEFPYPTVTLSDGKSVKLDKAAFNLYRAVPNREDRQKVMSAFFNALGAYTGTFGATMNTKVQGDVFYAKSRKYENTVTAALNGPNIPVSVYTRLVDGVNRHLPTFHRYLRLRKKMMGLQQLHYYDLYAPLVGSLDVKYPVEEAQRHILASLEPLGAEYASVVARAFNERWIDLYPTAGKRAGITTIGTRT
jgi:oligoendopeptidase F